MSARDYDTTSVSDKLGLDDIIRGLAGDLADLRANKISNHDAIARALLAKQIFNGVRLYLVGAKYLEQNPQPPKPTVNAAEISRG